MKKKLGSVLALYPIPVTVVGAMVSEKPNWLPAAHVGILGYVRILVSLAKPQYTNQGIKENGAVSSNPVNEALLPKADAVGCASGQNADKVRYIRLRDGDAGAPAIIDSPLSMECTIANLYETNGFDNFTLKTANGYADEAVLNRAGKPDYQKRKPVPFVTPAYQYLQTGEVIGRCVIIGKE